MLGLTVFFCAVIADEFDELPPLNFGRIESALTGKEEDAEEDNNDRDVVVVADQPIQESSDQKETFQNRICTLQQKLQDIYIETALCSPTALTAISRPQICGQGFFLFADALYWRIFEGGTDYGITNVNQFGGTSLFNLTESSEPRRSNFKWSWGYRVGAAYYVPHDEWDLSLMFTNYQTKAHDQFQGENNSNIGDLYGPAIANIFAQECELHSKIKYMTLDLKIGRGFFLNYDISVRPFAAVRGAWIRQHFDIFYQQTSPLIPVNAQLMAGVKTKNNFAGVGPEAGLDAQMFFNSHWSFFSQFSAALLYGKFDVLYLLTSNTVAAFDIQANTHRIVPMVQTILGVGWETDFQNNDYYLAAHFGYELQVWWRQNQQLSFDGFTTWVRYTEDLGLHGLTVDVRLDF